MESSSRVRNALLTAAGLLGAVVLVAVAARGETSTGDARSRTPSDALWDVLFGLYLVALLVGAVLFVYMLVLRRHLDVENGQARRKSVIQMLVSTAILLAVGALLARRLMHLQPPPPIQPREGLGQGELIPVDTSPQPTTNYEPDVSWTAVLVTVGLVLVAFAAWWHAGRVRRRARGEVEPLAAAVVQAVDESLDDLRAEPDPRRAVIAAYARLERVLAAHGLPRAPSEAPMEYLARILTELSVSDRAARALTELFERAKFSQHAVGPEMKEQAIEALETVRDDLLAAQALAEQERTAALTPHREQPGPAQ